MPELGGHACSPCSVHPRNILNTVYLLMFVYFSLTSVFWIHCLSLADIFNVRAFASLSPWTQTSRGKTLTERSWSSWHWFIGTVGTKLGLPCEETSEFPVVRGLHCEFSESRLWLSQRRDIVQSTRLEAWPSWNPRLLGKSKRFLLSRSHIAEPYESLRILVYFYQLRTCMCPYGMDYICYIYLEEEWWQCEVLYVHR